MTQPEINHGMVFRYHSQLPLPGGIGVVLFSGGQGSVGGRVA